MRQTTLWRPKKSLLLLYLLCQGFRQHPAHLANLVTSKVFGDSQGRVVYILVSALIWRYHAEPIRIGRDRLSSLNPLSWLLNDSSAIEYGLRAKCTFYAGIDKNLRSPLPKVVSFSRDIRIEFSLDKCRIQDIRK